jgi:hypothetical protein
MSVAALFLTRANYVVLAPLAIGICVFRFRRRGWHCSIVVAAFALLPICGWMARNIATMPQGFNPLGVNMGMAVWDRAVELGDGSIQQKILQVANDPDFQTLHGSADLSLQLEADKRLFLRGIRVIRSQWMSFVTMTFWALVFREWVETYSPSLPGVVLLMTATASAVLLGLAYVGVILVRGNWILAVPLVVLCMSIGAVHAPFFMEGRYTAPVRPVLYMFSVVSIVKIGEFALRWYSGEHR